MEDYEMMARAKRYLEELAAGRDPLTGDPVGEDSVISNPRLRRCFRYAAQVLGQDAEREERRFLRARAKEQRERRVNPTSFSREALERFSFSDEPIPIMQIAARFNDLLADDTVKKLCYRDVSAFLLDAGILREAGSGDGKAKRLPTPFGESLGVLVENRVNKAGTPYSGVVYSRSAQRFIVDNIDSILLIAEGRE